MRKTNFFIVLMESRATGGFHWRRLARPPQIGRSDFLPLFKSVPPTHAFARVLFTTRQRYFQLWVQFSVRPAPARLLKHANRVLATLTVGHMYPKEGQHPLVTFADSGPAERLTPTTVAIPDLDYRASS
jgi:hypothetical protein